MIPTLSGYAKPTKVDPRDHRPSPLMAKRYSPKAYKYHMGGPKRDQGNRPWCVEYTTRGLVEANPVRNKILEDFGVPYAWMQKNDYWAGENYDGTSIHAAMQWLKLNGYISSYSWAKTVEELHAFIRDHGCACVGSDWHWNMFTPDRHGYLRLGGGNAGGHGYLLRGTNAERVDPGTNDLGAFLKRGSWGPDWGKTSRKVDGIAKGSGEAWIGFTEMRELMKDPFVEVALPIETRRAA